MFCHNAYTLLWLTTATATAAMSKMFNSSTISSGKVEEVKTELAAKLPSSCRQSATMIQCSKLDKAKLDELGKALLMDLVVDFVFLDTSEAESCSCEILRLLHQLSDSDIAVITSKQCHLGSYKLCGYDVPDEGSGSVIVSGLVVSPHDSKMKWAIKHHVIPLWNRIKNIHRSDDRVFVYHTVLRDVSRSEEMLTEQAEKSGKGALIYSDAPPPSLREHVDEEEKKNPYNIDSNLKQQIWDMEASKHEKAAKQFSSNINIMMQALEKLDGLTNIEPGTPESIVTPPSVVENDGDINNDKPVSEAAMEADLDDELASIKQDLSKKSRKKSARSRRDVSRDSYTNSVFVGKLVESRNQGQHRDGIRLHGETVMVGWKSAYLKWNKNKAPRNKKNAAKVIPANGYSCGSFTGDNLRQVKKNENTSSSANCSHLNLRTLNKRTVPLVRLKRDKDNTKDKANFKNKKVHKKRPTAFIMPYKIFIGGDYLSLFDTVAIDLAISMEAQLPKRRRKPVAITNAVLHAKPPPADKVNIEEEEETPVLKTVPGNIDMDPVRLALLTQAETDDDLDEVTEEDVFDKLTDPDDDLSLLDEEGARLTKLENDFAEVSEGNASGPKAAPIASPAKPVLAPIVPAIADKLLIDRKRARDKDHIFKNFIIFVVAIIGMIIIFAVLIIMSMRKTPTKEDMQLFEKARKEKMLEHEQRLAQRMHLLDKYDGVTPSPSPFATYSGQGIKPTGDPQSDAIEYSRWQPDMAMEMPILGGRHVITEFDEPHPPTKVAERSRSPTWPYFFRPHYVPVSALASSPPKPLPKRTRPRQQNDYFMNNLHNL